ncbi:trigger factor [Mailhella sp.]|uniref:trigger factor n=1 Tax=Mailhella sp. TaxID=1981029 RepID=UPI0040637E40
MESRIERDGHGQCRAIGMIPEAEVLVEWKKAAQRFASAVQIPGFRRGKAPLTALEKQFGAEIAELVTDTLVQRALSQAFEREGVTPITGFEYEGGLAQRGQGLNFEASFGVLPEFDQPDLASIAVDKAEAVADPVQEELFLREMLARGAEKVNVTEGTPQDGDLVMADVEGRVDGAPVPGLCGPVRMRLVASVPGEKEPELVPIIRSLHVGETGTGSTLCPPDFPDHAMRGRVIEIIVTLRGIERDLLPELSDESAGRLGFRSAEAMRMRAHEQAQDMARLHKRSRSLEGMQAMLELWPGFDAPEAMVKQCTREAISRAAQQMQQFAAQGGMPSSLEQMEKDASDNGARKARCRTLLLGWARANGVELPESEVDAVLRGRAARRQMSLEEYLVSTGRSGETYAVRAAMLEQKALYALYDTIVNAESPAE